MLQILSVFQERRVGGEEVQRFEDLLMQQRELFAEEEVKASFPKLVSFVLQVNGFFLSSFFCVMILTVSFCCVLDRAGFV